MMAGRGDDLPVSAMPVDGTYPERHDRLREAQDLRPRRRLGPGRLHPVRQLQLRLPAQRHPGQVLRRAARSTARPTGFQSAPLNAAGLPGSRYTLQVYAEDCTGCGLCVEACPVSPVGRPAPARRSTSSRSPPCSSRERENVAFFETLPVNDRSRVDFGTVRGTQFLEPLFEFSGACSGCGETPYLKLLTQLFGERLTVANATGCSSIYGGNLPTTPWTKNAAGPRPGLVELAVRGQRRVRPRPAARRRPAHQAGPQRLDQLREEVGAELADAHPRRRPGARVRAHRPARAGRRAARAGSRAWTGPVVEDLRSVADHLLRRTVWIVGGDGWAYDIGSGGLDHVLASGRNVNVLVLDTEVYSNTGGQSSKSTPMGAVAKFAAAGKAIGEEGPRAAGDRLRQRLRRPRGHGRRPAPDADGVPRGRGLRRAVAHHRLQPLHRARHRDEQGPRPAVPRRRLRALAAGALRPRGAGAGRQPVPARLAPAAHPARGLPLQRAALPDAAQRRPRGGRAAARPRARRPSTSGGRPTRRWRPAAPTGSPPTPRRTR